MVTLAIGNHLRRLVASMASSAGSSAPHSTRLTDWPRAPKTSATELDLGNHRLEAVMSDKQWETWTKIRKGGEQTGKGLKKIWDGATGKQAPKQNKPDIEVDVKINRPDQKDDD